MGTATVPEILHNSWLLMYDSRFAHNTDLVFLLYDQAMRHEVNRGVALNVNANEHLKKLFEETCNAPDFEQRLDHVLAHRNEKLAV